MPQNLPVFFTYLYNIPIYALLIGRNLFNSVISVLPVKTQQQIRWWRDSLVAVSFIAFGPFLPPLTVPDVDLSSKTAIVTGANSGIGLQIASDLAQRNATVYLACRTQSKAEQAIQAIIKKFPHAKGRVHFAQMDTSSLASVRKFAALWTTQTQPRGRSQDDSHTTAVTTTTNITANKIDILVHNAGIAGPPSKTKAFSADGFEITYATNFLGSFLLTYLLEKQLSATARVIFTSSTAQYMARFSRSFALDDHHHHPTDKDRVVGSPRTNIIEPGFHCPILKLGPFRRTRQDAFAIYSHTKAMQGAFARCLQQRFSSMTTTTDENMKIVHYFSPDLTSTPILGSMRGRSSIVSDVAGWILSRLKGIAISVEQGAATGSWLAVEPNDDRVVNQRNGGKYWDQMVRLTSTPDLMDQDLLDRLWTRWECDAGIVWR